MWVAQGIYACRFWFLGKWETVLVDDYVPCRRLGLGLGLELKARARVRVMVMVRGGLLHFL